VADVMEGGKKTTWSKQLADVIPQLADEPIHICCETNLFRGL
jgi:hypothetical protein